MKKRNNFGKSLNERYPQQKHAPPKPPKAKLYCEAFGTAPTSNVANHLKYEPEDRERLTSHIERLKANFPGHTDIDYDNAAIGLVHLAKPSVKQLKEELATAVEWNRLVSLPLTDFERNKLNLIAFEHFIEAAPAYCEWCYMFGGESINRHTGEIAEY